MLACPMPDRDRQRQTEEAQLDEHIALAAALRPLMPDVTLVADRISLALERGGRVYTFGNGGSAADAQHLAAELIGRFRRERPALPAVALSTDPSVVTAIANDYAYEDVFARQVEALATAADVVVAWSTTGNSDNVVRGLRAAREAGATTVLIAGADGGPAREHADVALLVPSTTTPRVQEMHVLLLHLISERVDAWAAEDSAQSPREGEQLAGGSAQRGE
jgi:D-sedoheptulose 7-phosphate isomerase